MSRKSHFMVIAMVALIALLVVVVVSSCYRRLIKRGDEKIEGTRLGTFYYIMWRTGGD